MRNLTLLILLLILHEFQGFSQYHFQKGTVITSLGDTIHGYIDCKDRSFDPEKFTFTRSIPKDTLITFSLPDARAFIIDKTAAYEKFTVNVSQGAVDIDRLPDKIDTSSIEKTVFLKVLVKGEPLSLFSYSDRIKTRYFVLVPGASMPQELQLYIYSPNHTELRYKKYIGQLLLLASKYGKNTIEQQHRISTSSYISQDLIPIVNEINGQKVKMESDISPNRIILNFFVGAGISRSYMAFSGTDPLAKLTSSPVACKPSIIVGFNLSEKSNSRAYISEMLMLSNLDYKIQQVTDYSANSYIETTTFHLKMTNIALANSFGYKVYNGGKTGFYLGAGLNINFSFYPTNDLIIIDEGYYNTNSEATIKDHYLMKRVWYSLPLKAGLIIRNRVEAGVNWYVPSPLPQLASAIGTLYDMQLAGMYHF